MNSVRGLFRFLIISDSQKARKPQWYSLDRIHLINNDEEELICYGKTVSGGGQGGEDKDNFREERVESIWVDSEVAVVFVEAITELGRWWLLWRKWRWE